MNMSKNGEQNENETKNNNRITFKYKIGDNIKRENLNIVIINRKVLDRESVSKNGLNKYKRRTPVYQYICNICGFDLSKDFYHKGILQKDKWAFEQGLDKLSVCPCCINRYVVTGINDIYTKNKEMLPYIVNESDAKRLSRGSIVPIDVKCNICNKISNKKMSPNDICGKLNYAIVVPCVCRDGKYMTERFFENFLIYNKIKYIKEFSPNWANKKRYDFLLEDKYIIEIDGDQHMTCRFKKTEKENDSYKKELACQNGFSKDSYESLNFYKSQFEYMWNSISNSKILNQKFKIDFSEDCYKYCVENSCTTLIKEVSDYYNEHLCDIKPISERFGIGKDTISRYLRTAKTLGWTNYNGRKHPVELIKDGVSLGKFDSIQEMVKNTNYGLNYSQSNRVARGVISSHNGYIIKRI